MSSEELTVMVIDLGTGDGSADGRNDELVVTFTGRRIGVSWWGPESGTPVVFATGAGMSATLGFAEQDLAELGVRLVGVERPGIGRSEPEPGRTLLSWADDVRAVLAHLGVERARIVGFSLGAPYALACAAAGIVEAVALVSAQDDVTHPATRRLLTPDVAALVDAVERDAALVETEFTAHTSAGSLHEFVLEHASAADLAVYSAPEFDVRYRRALAEGFAQSAAGYAADLVLGLSPWPFSMEEIDVPVELWFGELDESTVHSPDRGAELERRLRGSRRHTVADAGGSVLWTHGAAILRSLMDR